MVIGLLGDIPKTYKHQLFQINVISTKILPLKSFSRPMKERILNGRNKLKVEKVPESILHGFSHYFVSMGFVSSQNKQNRNNSSQLWMGSTKAKAKRQLFAGTVNSFSNTALNKNSCSVISGRVCSRRKSRCLGKRLNAVSK